MFKNVSSFFYLESLLFYIQIAGHSELNHYTHPLLWQTDQGMMMLENQAAFSVDEWKVITPQLIIIRW